MNKGHTMNEHVKKFMNGWSGSRLLEKHSLSDYGFWKARGEDPNCDMGGSHNLPELGIFEGKLEDVINYVVLLPGWYNWGSGGNIEAYSSKKIKKITADSVNELKNNHKKVKDLKAELERIKNEIAELEN
jgi:hypothetical protein